MPTQALDPVSLDDKYSVERGRILISGRQALVRLPLLQRQLDRQQGLRTAGYISGYRGSPLAGYDMELWKARRLLEQNDIVFHPGLNEDLAATAIWGTQQLDFLPGRKVDGVFAIWYGKGPGVDRSGDALKHANMAGTAPHGGVLLVFGDDHSGKSSSLAHQSDLALAAHEIPILYPATVAEILQFGLAGIALSRYSGLLVGLKIVNETAETTSVATIDLDTFACAQPQLAAPADGVNIRKEFMALQRQDRRMVDHKLPRARAFARLNGLDRVVFGTERARFVIVTAGKPFADVMQALALLGIDATAAQRLGLAVYKVGMIFPLEAGNLRAVCSGAQEILVVEEKRPHLEIQAAAILFNGGQRARLSGKNDPQGVRLLPSDVGLDPSIIATALARRLAAAMPDEFAALPDISRNCAHAEALSKRATQLVPAAVSRRPTFCPGCPHNTSTVVPQGSFGMTGIGCHGMTMFFPDRNPLPVSHMGGEGAMWLGMAPFTSTQHVFQNLGDGTYNHSGSLAIRAAVQAKVNITYKILYNDAVAMTGGQPVEGELTVGRIARQVLAEGVLTVVVVSEAPERFTNEDPLPDAVQLRHRSELEPVQRMLRDTPGVTVLIYDQTCAAEKRRRRKRGNYPDPNQRIYINHLVCEGCGDCSTQSSCSAIQPLETHLGRKRRIDQSACNKDFSCTKGFCPSFVTVHDGALQRRKATHPVDFPVLPDPQVPPLEARFDLLITGVGGTGIVTIGAIIGMAAHLEGRGASVHDMTGLSQKGGAVLSHVRLFPQVDGLAPAKLGAAEAALVLACDAIAATQTDALQTIGAERTTVVVNTEVTAPAAFERDPDLDLGIEQFLNKLRTACAKSSILSVPSSLVAERTLGDSLAVNMIMLGFAWQSALVPLSRAAIERAIELNGVAVSFNLQAFLIGRAVAATSAGRVMRMWNNGAEADPEPPEHDLDTFIARRTEDLTHYWNADYAGVYANLVNDIRAKEAQLGLPSDALAWAVARFAYKLMAYKDEYEVARLYSDGRFRAALAQEFSGDYRLSFHLAPPLLSRGARGSRPRKITLGPWAMVLFRGLARCKFLRESRFDIFGYTDERRLERHLREQYIAVIRRMGETLSIDNHPAAVALATQPQHVRGFGFVKEEAARAVLARLRAD